MILYAKKSTVSQPKALIDVPLQIYSTFAALGMQCQVCQGSLIADVGHFLDLPLKSRPRLPESNEEVGDLLETVTRLCLRKLGGWVIVGVGVPEFRSGPSYFLGTRDGEQVLDVALEAELAVHEF
jgi:hypothetical protein